MDSINGIPLIWDSEGDKNLFGKLFQGVTSPSLPSNNKFPQFPVNNDFTTLSPKDIGNKYYGNNPVYDSKGVRVYTDEDIPPNTIQLKEVKVYNNDFYKEFKDFSFTLFVSKDGARLLTQYKECVVSSDEIALFLEINDVNNFTGSVMEAKVGSKVNQSKLPIAQMLVFMRDNKVNLEDSEIFKLINGAFSSRNSLLHWLYSAGIRVATGITTFVFDSLDAINQGIISVFDALLIDEKHWNTEVKEYSNFFIPTQLLELLKINNNDSKVAEALLLPITLQIDGIEKGIAGSLKLVKPILPNAIYDNLDQNLKLKFKEIDVFFEHIKQDSFLEFVKTATEVANAYLCGFINSIVEFFKGIFEIIGIVLNMLKTFVLAKVDPLYYTSLLIEIFENIIEVIINFDLKQFIINAFTYPLVLLQKIFAFVKNTNFNLEGIKINLSKIGYIGGYIIGLVVAIIIDALLTGGVKAVEDIIKALQTFLTKPGTVLKDLLQTAGRKTVAVVETVIDLIATLARKLKNGAVKLFEDFKGFIDDVFKWLEELFGAIKKIRIGSGGFFKYQEIISRNMIAQEESMSCAAACIRQYAKDNKIEITEKLIRELAGTDAVLGTTDIGIIKGLEDVFKNKEILSNTYFRNSEEIMPQILKDISEDGSWIASIHPVGAKKHAIIVDKIVGNKIYIRDPWPLEGIGEKSGIEAIADLDEFSKAWLRAGANRYKIK
jgi:hypothetical protein